MNLTCVVKDSPEPPQFIFWYHDQSEISYDSPRGGVSQITEKGETALQPSHENIIVCSGSTTSSFLLIQHSKLSDSGSYSCQPTLGNLATARVHVVRSMLNTSNIFQLTSVFMRWRPGEVDDRLCWKSAGAVYNILSFDTLSVLLRNLC